MPAAFTYGGNTILSNPIFVETVLPFLLVFTIVFAILQKSEILGKGKKQIDAIVSLVVGLLVISFGQATGIIVQLIPFLAVSLVIILVLLILMGFFSMGEPLKLHNNFKYAMWAAAIIAVIIAVLYITDGWLYILGFLSVNSSSNGIVVNIIFIAIIIGAIFFVMRDKGGKPSSSDK